MNTWRIEHGDALTRLQLMPEASVQCGVTSPPYFGLRDYGTGAWDGGDPACQHQGKPKPRQDTSGSGVDKGRFASTRGTQPAKRASNIPVRDVCSCGARRIDQQVGLEVTPGEYVDRLVEIFMEFHRVLTDDGVLWVNLGDSYTADKDLLGIPWRVALALQASGWYLRCDVIWSKPNPMPESVEDRPSRSHEYVFLLTKSARYYFDHVAIQEVGAVPAGTRAAKGSNARSELKNVNSRPPDYWEYTGKRNARSVWSITTKPCADAHFAVMPEALATRCILAGSRRGDTILDPFAGRGTTGLAALGNGRNFVGIELNAANVALSRKNLSDVAPMFAHEVSA